MLKVRVGAHAVPPSTCVTLISGSSQLSVAVTRALTLSSVGRLVGLQPRSPPSGILSMDGATVSLTRIVCETLTVSPHGVIADQVRVILFSQEDPGAVCTSSKVT